jgi:DNA-binding transcriptional LysR family regulator
MEIIGRGLDRYLIRYFLAVVEAGNFSRAAASVHVAQPTLSVGVAKLERELGAPLFIRGRKVRLTDAGARFLPHARAIERAYNLAVADLSAEPASQPLRVGVLVTLSTDLLEIIVSALEPVARASLELVDGGERELYSMLERGRVDLALSILRPGRFSGTPLFREAYTLALPSSHPLAARQVVDAEELRHDRIIIRRHCEALGEVSRHFVERGLRPPVALRTHSDSRALQMVRAGLGVTVMPSAHRLDGVVRPRLGGVRLERQIGLLFSDRSVRGPQAGGAFIEAAAAAVAGLDRIRLGLDD